MALCINLAWLLPHLMTARPWKSSPVELSRFLAAATAGLQLLPGLTQLDARQQSSNATGAALYSSDLLVWLPEALPLLELSPQLQRISSGTAALPAEEATAWDSLPAQLWALHTSQCRLVAALTSPAEPWRRPGRAVTSHCWRMLQCSLSNLLQLVAEMYWLRCRSAARDTVLFALKAPR